MPLGFTPYRHQRTAFWRLAAGAGRSTVVATGTGSGKTECFLFPILDYCRERAGAPGIKAILVYPMNALAADQARRVFRPVAVEPGGRGDSRSTRLSRDCPYCGAREALIIVGARAANLLSVALGQAQGSRYNDDRKVIAFSDNVQDAAHRAGFFAARTAGTAVRAAIAQVVDRHDGIALVDLPERVETWWRDTGVNPVNPEAFDDERFVREFIAPDRLWRRDFVTLQREGACRAGSRLPGAVAERLRWDTLAELGYRSAIGRTLEPTRAAAVGADREALERACRDAHLRIREQFGALRGLAPAAVRSLVLGILRRMKDRGAIRSDVAKAWLAEGAGRWWLSRQPALQDFGPRSARPIFPVDTPRTGDGIEPLCSRNGSRKPWYQAWVERVLTPVDVLTATREAPDVLLEALRALENAPAVLERQLTAFCLDGWAATGLPEDAVPRTIRHVLDNVEQARLTGFPYPFLDFVQQRGDDLLETFFDALAGELTEQSRDYLAAFLQNDPEALDYAAVIVDEGQDMGAQAYRLLRAVVPAGLNDLFVVGDGHQRIYGRYRVVLGRCGIDVRGRSRKLRLNYRTTEETRRWAARLLAGRAIDDLDGGSDDDKGITSLTRGPEPLLRHFENRDDQSTFIVNYLKRIQAEDSSLRGVCVVARTRHERDAVAATLGEHGLAHVALEAGAVDSAEKEGVRLATMHRVKGLEFDRVVMASVNADLVPLPAAVDARGDAVERESAETEERALVYVAATRAKQELLVLSFDKPSRLL